MIYFKVDADTFIRYDEIDKNVKIVSLKLLKEMAIEIAANIPIMPTNAVLLAWARINYPGITTVGDGQKKLDRINAEIVEINKIA